MYQIGRMQSYIVSMIIVMCIRSISANESTAFEGFRIPCRDTSSRCIKDSFQAVFSEFVRGIPSLGIESLDPLIADKVNLAMPGGLSIEFTEGQTKGLKKCTINSASVNENRFNVVLHCNFTTKGKYRSYGKMLMFSIDGKGDATIACKNLKIECSFVIGTTERNSKKYLVIKEQKIKHSYQGQVYYNITNLFKGNPEISNMVLEFMNQNWHAVAEEFGDPIVNLGFQSVINNVEKLLQTVPADQLLRENDDKLLLQQLE